MRLLENALLVALIPAVGNALYAYGQRQARGVDNDMLYVFLSVAGAAALALALSFLWGPVRPLAMVRANLAPLAISAAGLAIVYVGFYLLFSRHGAGAYFHYAALSVLTTTVGLGFWWYRERFNWLHVAAVALMTAGMGVFYLAQKRG